MSKYDRREDCLHGMPWSPMFDKLASYIERLEAELDALLARQRTRGGTTMNDEESDYSVEDALVDLDAIEEGALCGDERAAAVRRVCKMMVRLSSQARLMEESGMLLGDDR